MAEQRIVHIAFHDGARGERIAAALEAGGDVFAAPDAAADADVSVMEEPGRLRIEADAGEARRGAEAVLPADADDDLVLAAIRLVAAGFSVVQAPAQEAEDDHPADASDRHRPAPTLSAREIEVLNLLADGAPNKVIARKLAISVHTAKFHVASLLSKLGAANRTDAIAIAMREGLVPV